MSSQKKDFVLIVFAAIVGITSVWVANILFGSSDSNTNSAPTTSTVSNPSLNESQVVKQKSTELENQQNMQTQPNSTITQPQTNTPDQATSTAQSSLPLRTNVLPKIIIQNINISPSVLELQSEAEAFLKDNNKDWHNKGISLLKRIDDKYWKNKKLLDQENKILENNIQYLIQEGLLFINDNYSNLNPNEIRDFINEIKKNKNFLSKYQLRDLNRIEQNLIKNQKPIK